MPGENRTYGTNKTYSPIRPINPSLSILAPSPLSFLTFPLQTISYGMFTLCVKDSFAAAHRLVGYKGKCEELHGHNFAVEVFLSGHRLEMTECSSTSRPLRQTSRRSSMSSTTNA